jgi:hypothetical protein
MPPLVRGDGHHRGKTPPVRCAGGWRLAGPGAESGIGVQRRLRAHYLGILETASMSRVARGLLTVRLIRIATVLTGAP